MWEEDSRKINDSKSKSNQREEPHLYDFKIGCARLDQNLYNVNLFTLKLTHKINILKLSKSIFIL